MKNVVGWLTFNVDVEDKDFKSKIKDAETEIKKLDKQGESLKKQALKIDLSDYKRQVREIQDEWKRADEAGEYTPGANQKYALEQIQKVKQEYSSVLDKSKEIGAELSKNLDKRKIEVQKLQELKQKQQEYNDAQEQENRMQEVYGKIGQSIDNIGNKTTSLIKKVGKWALAIFSVRSAYMFVRSAVSTLSQSNEKLASDLEYIRWALAKTLEKTIERIVKWVYKVLQAINYIVYSLTGVNLFANATADAFGKTKDNLDGAGKSAKELQKTVAGFDEMNVLQDSGATSYGGGGGGVTLPTEDLSKFNLLSEDTKKRLDKIVEGLKVVFNWINENIVPIVKTFWNGILKPALEAFGKWVDDKPQRLLAVIGAIIGLKLASKLGLIGGTFKTIGSLISTLIGKIGLSAGGGATLVGVLAVLDVILVGLAVNGMKKVIDEGKELKKDIEEDIALSNSYVKSTEKTKNAIVEKAKAGEINNDVAKKDVDLILSQISDNQYLNRELSQHLGWKEKLTGEYKKNTQLMNDNTEANQNNLEMLKALYDQGYMNTQQKVQYMNALRNEISNLELTNENLKENSEEYKTNKERIEKLKKSLDDVKGNYKANINVDADQKTVDDVTNAIKDVAKNHTITLSASTKKANSTIGSFLKNLGSSLFSVIFPTLSFASTIAKFHRKGGIINNPGRGVPIDMGGEGGPEGIIPLTDQQQMEILGKSIGKYVTINLTNITKLDSREMQRTTEQVKADNDFIRNR